MQLNIYFSPAISGGTHEMDAADRDGSGSVLFSFAVKLLCSTEKTTI